jgi:hypothetical protein
VRVSLLQVFFSMTVNPSSPFSPSAMDQKQAADVGKGKAKAVQQDPDTTSSSLASRIASSASRLAKDAVTTPGGDLTQSLATSSAASGKSRPTPSSSTGQPHESLETKYRSPFPTGDSSSSLGSSTAFRSLASDTGTAAEFEDFVTNSGSERALRFTGLENRGDLPIRRNGHEAASWSSEFHGRDEARSMWQDAAALDGAEVVELLSDPCFVAMTDVYDTADPSADDVSDLFALNLDSEAERTATSKIRSALPSAPQHRPVAANNPMNLIPSLDAQSQSLLASTPEREAWFAEWSGVLNGYTDEVWGDLLPVVREAQKDMEEVKAGAKDVDMKALQRLRMIVGHIQMEQQSTQTGSDLIQEQGREQEQAAAVHHRQEEESDGAGVDFHCPWYSCHERFDDMRELRRHSQTHRQYPCPHATCREGFAERAEWAKHISIAHHDRLS